VPDVLLTGHHAEVAQWRQEQSYLRTKQRRADLLDDAGDRDQPQTKEGEA
jgi:tRNA (guanine37-N1)-methyltransferase